MNEDVAILGGGIVGLLMAIRALEYGRRPIVLERGAIGRGASCASLNVVHGGLRSLQSLDLQGWRRARRAQGWWARHHPRHVRPLVCTMPLYTRSLRSRTAMRAAFALDRALTQLEPGSIALEGRLRSRAEVLDRWDVAAAGLTGAAEWREWSIADPTALMQELADTIRAQGGSMREGVDTCAITRHNGRMAAVQLADGDVVEATAMLLCAGSAGQTLARRIDPGVQVPSSCTLGWNVLFDRSMPTDTLAANKMLAVSPVAGRGRSLFLREEGGRTLAGTGYAACEAGDRPVQPAAADLDLFCSDVIKAYPALADAAILEVRAGQLPDNGTPGTLRQADLLIDHGACGGTPGVLTLSATKLSTAPLLASDAASWLWGRPLKDQT
ncbi:FAD-dependent oxidoreductase [Croceicoccus sp. F390]|uniref:FAD-dependent oxidoreductase n=1 Tax=Croceicoccus esteveae TaxID=3075597 RepID=A0ABU2ZK45_9SPHN|nr:FAD-dependent oxidoreductase [Croceicoccus sp. F390]MDT0576973.1 FAD-dependent oxidoreductase [Croceicoccus sp. F390]